MELDGKVTLVTGAGSGIGAAIAALFARAGGDVALVDKDRDALRRTVTQLNDAPGRVVAVEADCGDVPAVQESIDKVVTQFGRIDILVNNAGLTFQVDMLALTEAEWDRVNRVNIKGVFFALQRAATHMIARRDGGRIINIASISGRGYSNSANPAYAASKGAVIALTQFASHHLAPHGINVNSICPGLTITDLFRSVMEQRGAERGIPAADVLAEVEKTIPLGRANTPDDIANMALFLAGPGGRNITGQAYNVDGGLQKN